MLTPALEDKTVILDLGEHELGMRHTRLGMQGIMQTFTRQILWHHSLRTKAARNVPPSQEAGHCYPECDQPKNYLLSRDPQETNLNHSIAWFSNLNILTFGAREYLFSNTPSAVITKLPPADKCSTIKPPIIRAQLDAKITQCRIPNPEQSGSPRQLRQLSNVKNRETKIEKLSEIWDYVEK